MSYAANPPPPKGGEKAEPTGPIASDSLAAESMETGGDFASNNPSAAVSSQKGSSSTFNNTDTSGARTLDPAGDATQRDMSGAEKAASTTKGQQGPKYPEGAGGQGSEEGKSGARTGTGIQGQHTESSTSDDKPSSSGSGTSSSGRNANQAPASATSGAGNLHTKDHLKPKGKNITEGGFSEDLENASMTGDIGGENDPGRLAERTFQKRDADTAGDGGPRQTELNEEGVGYKALDPDISA